MGNFNLDLQYNHHVPTQEFIDSLFSHAFSPLISNPIHLKPYSSTLIDNIFTNNLSQSVFDCIVLNDLYYRLPVFTYFDNKTLTRRGEKKIPSLAINAINRPFAAKPSRDLLFIKLWAATLRMPEIKNN